MPIKKLPVLFRRVIYCLIVAAAALTHGCFLTSENLIGGEGAVFSDDKIAGMWYSPGKQGFFMVMRHKDNLFSFHFFERGFESDSEFYEGKITKISGETFLNMRRHASLGEKATDTAYIPAHYKLVDDKLTLSLFNTAPFDRAIAEKKLKGVAGVKTSKYSTTPTRLTGSGDEVAKYILANLKSPEIFDKPTTFERLKVDLPVAEEKRP